MPRKVKFTKEEKEEDIKDVEAMLRDNPNCHVIAAELGRSVQYICNIKDYLDEEGILTKEELEQIALEKEEEKNREFDKKLLELIQAGKNKNKIRQILQVGNKTVNDAYEKLSAKIDLSEYLTEEELLEIDRLKKVKDFVNDGTGSKSLTQIVVATDIPYTTVKRMIEKLISDGSIKAENIINKHDENREKLKKRNEEIYALLDDNVPIKEIAERYHLSTKSVLDIKSQRTKKRVRKPKTRKKDYDIKEPDDSLNLLEKSILEYLKKGLSYNYICKKENLLQNDLMKLISSLKERKYITQTIINEARETRRLYYLDTIESFLRDGYSNSEIYKEINPDGEEVTTTGICRIIKELINNGKITQKEIDKARSEREKSIDSRISPLVRKGYTVKEIFETDKKTFLTEGRVRDGRKRVIASENITQEQLEKWQKQRRLEKQNEIYKQDEKIIWGYVEEYGYDDNEIAPLIDAGIVYVGNRRRAYQNKHKISDKKFKLIKAKGLLKRKQREEQESKKENKNRKPLEEFYKIKLLYQKEYESSLPKLTTKQRYFEKFKEVTELGIYSFTKEDIDILSFIVLYEEEYLTDENIKYVMEKYLSIGEEEQAMKLLNNYINGDGKPRVNDAVMEMRFIIQKYKQGTK